MRSDRGGYESSGPPLTEMPQGPSGPAPGERGHVEPGRAVPPPARSAPAPSPMPRGLWRTERPLSVADADRIRAAYREHGAPWQDVVEEFGLTRTDAPGVILLGADPTEGEAFRNA